MLAMRKGKKDADNKGNIYSKFYEWLLHTITRRGNLSYTQWIYNLSK